MDNEVDDIAQGSVDDIEVEYYNKRNDVPITGLSDDMIPFILILFLSVFGMVFTSLFKRRAKHATKSPPKYGR